MSTFIIRFIGFVCMPYFAARISLYEFGVWDYYQIYFQLGTMLISSCSSFSLTRFYSLQKDHAHQAAVVSNAAVLLSLFFVLLAIGLYVSSLWFSLPMYAYVTGINIGFFSFFSLYLAYLRVHDYVDWYCFLFVSQGLVAIILTALGVYYQYGLDSYFYANGVSFLLFSVGFFSLLWRFRRVDVSLLKQQMAYGFPMVVHNLSYMGFFFVDRFVLQYVSGFEMLGLYSLLWRFGALFQFFALALFEVWHVMIFRVHREVEYKEMLKELSFYFCLLLTTACLSAIVVARCSYSYICAAKYDYLISYIPCYFFPMVMVEIGRILQSGCMLTGRTVFISLLSVITFTIQLVFLCKAAPYGLWGILFINCGTFILYALGSYGCTLLSGQKIFDGYQLLRLQTVFIVFLGIMHYMAQHFSTFCWYWFIGLFLLWPLIIWKLVLSSLQRSRVSAILRLLGVYNRIHEIISHRLS